MNEAVYIDVKSLRVFQVSLLGLGTGWTWVNAWRACKTQCEYLRDTILLFHVGNLITDQYIFDCLGAFKCVCVCRQVAIEKPHNIVYSSGQRYIVYMN